MTASWLIALGIARDIIGLVATATDEGRAIEPNELVKIMDDRIRADAKWSEQLDRLRREAKE